VPRVPLFHLYTDVNNLLRKLHWDPEDEKDRVLKWTELDKKSKDRLKDLVHNKIEHPFGLGELRTIDGFSQLSGLDLIKKEIIDLERATDGFSFVKIFSSDAPFTQVSVENE